MAFHCGEEVDGYDRCIKQCSGCKGDALPGYGGTPHKVIIQIKRRYALIWLDAYCVKYWICVDVTAKPFGMTVRDYYNSMKCGSERYKNLNDDNL